MHGGPMKYVRLDRGDKGSAESEQSKQGTVRSWHHNASKWGVPKAQFLTVHTSWISILCYYSDKAIIPLWFHVKCNFSPLMVYPLSHSDYLSHCFQVRCFSWIDSLMARSSPSESKWCRSQSRIRVIFVLLSIKLRFT